MPCVDTLTLPHDLCERVTIYTDRDSWLAGRQGFLGASELAAVLGMSHYADASPMRVWQRQCAPGATPEPDARRSAWLDMGHRMEPVILTLWEERNPGAVLYRVPHLVAAHPVYPRLRGTPDALVFRDGVLVSGVDAKNLGVQQAKNLGEEGSDEVPVDYLMQGLAYCEIFEVPEWHFAVLLGGQRYLTFRVERNAAVAETIIGRALTWWALHVEARTPPPADGSEGTTRLLAALYPRPELPALPASEEAIHLGRLSRAARAAIAAAEEQQGAADNRLRQIVGPHDGIDGVCTWRANKPSKKTDWLSAFAELAARSDPEAAREIAARHTTEKPGARVFRLTIP